MESFQEGMEHETNDCQEESRNVDKDVNNECPKETEENEDNEGVINFNEDLLCEHNSLKTADSSRRVIPHEAWSILRKYFPDSKEYSIGSPSCSICEVSFIFSSDVQQFRNAVSFLFATIRCFGFVCVQEKMENAEKAKKDDKIKARQQKDELTDLYYGRNRNEISKCNDPEKPFYIVEKSFLDSWRSFIR